MKRFTTILGGIAVILFLLFFIFSMLIGGDALHGYTENGDYYVSGLGDTVAVSQTIWILNYISGILGLGGIVLYTIVFIIIKLGKT